MLTIHASSAWRFLKCPRSVGGRSLVTEYTEAGTQKHTEFPQADRFGRVRELLGWHYRMGGGLQYQLSPDVELRGTPDAWAVHPDKIVIIDYKSGYQYVSPENNPQLMSYALLLSKLYPSERFELGIATDGTVVVTSVGDDDLEEFSRRLVEAAASPREESPGAHCVSCPRIMECPETQAAIALVQDGIPEGVRLDDAWVAVLAAEKAIDRAKSAIKAAIVSELPDGGNMGKVAVRLHTSTTTDWGKAWEYLSREYHEKDWGAVFDRRCTLAEVKRLAGPGVIGELESAGAITHKHSLAVVPSEDQDHGDTGQ